VGVRRILAAGAAVLALLVLASAVACSPGSGPRQRTIEVTIHHSRFEPSEIAVPSGTAVRFVIKNTDPIDHEFILGNQEVQDRHENGTEPHHGTIPGEVSIPAGTVASTTYSFGGSGLLLLGCHLPGHWDYGMRGLVKVV
jgi:uncharacterized cupredoxin-like copper-binding protein